MSNALNTENKSNFDLLTHSICLKFNESVLVSYLFKLFDYLSTGKHSLNRLTFYNWSKLPLFIAMKIFNVIKPIDKKKLNKEHFASQLSAAYIGSISERISFVFNLLDFNKNQIIYPEDARILIEQFHSINNCGDIQTAYIIIEDFFGKEDSLTISQFKDKIYYSNSDLFYLIYTFIVFHKPFDTISLNYYHKEELEKEEDNSKSDNKDGINHSLNQFKRPTENLYHYLLKQFNIDFNLNSEIEELDDFENSLIQCKEKMNTNIQFVNVLNVFRRGYTLQANEDQSLPASVKTFKDTNNSICNMSTSIACNQSYLSDYNICSLFKLHDIISPSHFNHCVHNSKSNNKYSYTVYSNIFVKDYYSKHKIDIIGDDIYVLENKDLYTIIPIRDIKVKKMPNIKDDPKMKDKQPVQLISCISNTIQRFTLYFEQKSQLNAFMNLINSKSNYVLLSMNYQIDKLIGKGGFGVVFKGIHKGTNQTVAIKILEKKYDSFDEMLYIRQEQSICHYLMKTPHDSIIKIIDVIESIDYVYIIQEYLNYGTLNSYLKQDFTKEITDEVALDIIFQLGSAISFLASHGIVHRDIKLENIMVQNIIEDEHNNINNKVNITLIDFGFSVIIGKDERLTDLVGTLYYLSPEVTKKERYSKCVDVWAFGVVLYYLLHGEFPLNAKTINDNGNTIYIRKSYSISQRSRLVKLTNCCLEKQYDKRPTIDCVVEVIKGIINCE